MKETLQIIGKYTVESSSGWKVELPSFEVLIYEEEGKSIRLALEDRPDAQGELEWIIYMPEAWRWNECIDEILTQGKITEILNRIDLAFWKLDLKIKKIV